MRDFDADWNQIWVLDNRVAQGQPLEFTADVLDLLRRIAPTVAIGATEADVALSSEGSTTALLQEIAARIRDGSHRLSRALNRAHRRRERGDLRGARKSLEDLLAVEVVPFYREQAEKQLEEVASLEAVAATGHVDANLPPWEQLPILAHRIEQGHALELTDDLRDFLRRTAPTVAISDTEAETALESTEGSEALIRMMMGRIRDGERRIAEALFRMTSLRDAGDLEGARQQMRDVLAEETVPLYREMAEENLAGLDEPPSAS